MHEIVLFVPFRRSVPYFIPTLVKAQRSTLQQSVTQDSNYIAGAYTVTQDSNQWHDCRAGQPQQPGLAQRLPETDSAKVLPTSDKVGFYLASSHQMVPQSTHPIKRACYSFIDLGRMKGWVGLVGW